MSGQWGNMVGTELHKFYFVLLFLLVNGPVSIISFILLNNFCCVPSDWEIVVSCRKMKTVGK